MPIEVRIDRQHRVVHATFKGVPTPEELHEYLVSTWARGHVEGYAALADLRGADSSLLPFGELLNVAGRAPDQQPALLAVVVASEDDFEKAHFFRTACDLMRPHATEVRSFSSLEEAQKWLAGAAASADRERAGR